MNKKEILDFMERVDRMKHPIRKYPTKTVVYLFHDNTRTLYSFQAAALRLGCRNLTIEQPSLESFEDTVRTVQSYGDAIVLRHPDPDVSNRAVSLSRIPILQAGLHGQMTQPLIDIYTLYQELKFRSIELDSEERETLHVTFLGYSRTVQPFIALLKLFPKIETHFTSSSEHVLPETDVLYMSRRQQEESYGVDKAYLAPTKPSLILMHPFPRSSELSTDVDRNPRSVYFQQSENGLYVRMALLDQVFSRQSFPTFYELFWMCIAKLASIFSR